MYRVGLLHGETPEPIEVTKPDSLPLSGCYTFKPNSQQGHETDEANIHLLAALGEFKSPFVPVEIGREYEGYSWAKLPTIDKVEVEIGETLQESYIWSGELICAESITVAANTSDGQVFKSAVCMAIQPDSDDDKPCWHEQPVLVTAAAQDRLNVSDIWYHLGGWSDEGDLYDTQEYSVGEELNNFWARLLGPYEQTRRKLLDELNCIKGWKQITLTAKGQFEIVYKNGKREIIKPPRAKNISK